MYSSNFESFEYTPYELKFRFTGQMIQGLLLRFHFPEGVGYGCYQSWQDLGLRNGSTIIERIKNRDFDHKLWRSVHYAELDCKSRLFSTDVPVYYSAPDILFDWEVVVKEMETFGFTTVKTKLTNLGDLPRLIEALTLLKSSGFKCILDFKSKFDSATLKNILDILQSFHDMISYIEDPCSEDPGFNIPVRVATDEKTLNPDNIRIWKPMRTPPPGRVDVVTSLLDHPIGQLAAIREAKNVSRGMPHGVATHLCFENWNTNTPFQIRNGHLSVNSDHREILQSRFESRAWRNP